MTTPRSPVTGQVFGRIVNRSGAGSQPLIVQANPVPYKPASLDTRQSQLVSRVAESTRGEVIGEAVIPAADWAWAICDANHPFPGTPNPSHICLKAGFDASKLYQVVYRSEEAYALGIGLAAWRDVGMFFKTAKADDAGTLNPVAGLVTHSIARGVSQPGNFLRGWLHLGSNQDETGKEGNQVHEVCHGHELSEPRMQAPQLGTHCHVGGAEGGRLGTLVVVVVVALHRWPARRGFSGSAAFDDQSAHEPSLEGVVTVSAVKRNARTCRMQQQKTLKSNPVKTDPEDCGPHARLG